MASRSIGLVSPDPKIDEKADLIADHVALRDRLPVAVNPADTPRPAPAPAFNPRLTTSTALEMVDLLSSRSMEPLTVY